MVECFEFHIKILGYIYFFNKISIPFNKVMTGKLEKSHVLYVTLKLNAHGREGDSAMASE